MKLVVLFITLVASLGAHAATQRDIESAISIYRDECKTGTAYLLTAKRSSFISIDSIKCSHFTVSLATSTYFDKGYNSAEAQLVLSRNHNKSLSQLLKHPPVVSLFHRYRSITKGKRYSIIHDNHYQSLIKHIKRNKNIHAIRTVEDLKHINKKQGLVITQFVDVQFTNIKEAFSFIRHVSAKYYGSPVSEMSVSL